IYDPSFARDRLSQESLGKCGPIPPQLLSASLAVSTFITVDAKQLTGEYSRPGLASTEKTR
ncbi:hypothetical protein MC885_021461, partial [Smutsia gigantea]